MLLSPHANSSGLLSFLFFTLKKKIWLAIFHEFSAVLPFFRLFFFLSAEKREAHESVRTVSKKAEAREASAPGKAKSNPRDLTVMSGGELQARANPTVCGSCGNVCVPRRGGQAIPCLLSHLLQSLQRCSN